MIDPQWIPLGILVIGVVTVIGMIIVLRMNAFLALITAAIVVSLLAAGEWPEKISRVAEAFGSTAGSIGIVIAMAAIIGKCMMDSGAADRIVRSLMNLMGEKRAPVALITSGYILSIPVFFDTVFYLLVPLARSLWYRTRKNYMLYLLAIAGGGVITHTLVPPTPGPLMVAAELKVDLGVVMIIGCLVGIPTAIVCLPIVQVMNRLMPWPLREYEGESEPEHLADDELPNFWLAILPVLLPVALIAANAILGALLPEAKAALAARIEAAGDAELLAALPAASGGERVLEVTGVVGNPSLALILSGLIAMATLVWKRGISLTELGKVTETALMSGGVIILITAAGGAFGAMLREAEVGTAIEQLVGSQGAQQGTMMLAFAFGVAALLKFSQGSSTVAMITTAGIIGAMGVSSEDLGFHLAYFVTAIGSGSIVGSWMNDSGFWIFSRMGGLTETETLKSWTVLLASLGLVAFGFTLLFSQVVPLVG